MTKDNDDKILAGILGGLVGLLAASPKIEDKQDLEKYRQFKAEVQTRQNRVGDLPNISKLLGSQYYNAFVESYRMFLFGFYRGTVILSAAIIENLLKDKYGEKNFKELIEEAKEKNLVNQTEYHLLHALRNERNPSAHDVLKEVKEDDAILVIRITNRLMHKFV